MDDAPNELEELKAKIDQAGMTLEAREKTLAELAKLKMMSPMSAEATVVRGYIDWMLSVPWKKRSKVRHDMKRAQDILEADHYGLEEVKERILEYLAVQKRVRKLKGPVLCLVGPPGLVKHHWVSHWPGRRIASLSVWRWVAFVMRRRFAVTAGLTLAPCPVN